MEDNEALELVALRHLMEGDTDKFKTCLPEQQPGGVEGRPQEDGHWINKVILEQGPAKNKTLLEVAIERGLYSFQDELLRAGASARAENGRRGRSPIHLACERGDWRALHRLLFKYPGGNSADPNARRGKFNRTALHICCAEEPGKKLKCLELLLRLPSATAASTQNGSGGASTDGRMPSAPASTSNGQQRTLDLNAADGNGQYAVYQAAKAGCEEAVRALLERGPDLERKFDGRTMREHLSAKMGSNKWEKMQPPGNAPLQWRDLGEDLRTLKEKLDLLGTEEENKEECLRLLRAMPQGDRHALLAGSNAPHAVSFDGGEHTLLQALVDRGFKDGVVEVLGWLQLPQQQQQQQQQQQCVDGTTPAKTITPLMMAAQNGPADILEELIEAGADLTKAHAPTGKGVLHFLLNGGDRDVWRLECLGLILERIPHIVNERDDKENAPLHLASKFWGQDLVRKLLDYGASFGERGPLGKENPVEDVAPETMEEFLDQSCLRGSENSGVHDEDFELTFRYSFLPRGRELEVLRLAGRSKGHRHILLHPVLSSFLSLKWEQAGHFYNSLLALRLLVLGAVAWAVMDPLAEEGRGREICAGNVFAGIYFIWLLPVASIVFSSVGMLWDLWTRRNNLSPKLLVYLAPFVAGILLGVAIDVAQRCPSDEEENAWNWRRSAAFKAVLVVAFVLRLFPILFKGEWCVTKKVFLPEMLFEILVLILTGWVLCAFCRSAPSRPLAATAVVAYAADFVMLFGKHPGLTTSNVYVAMLCKVTGTFFSVLVHFSWIIVAFALGFFVMMRDVERPDAGLKDKSRFDSPLRAASKASVMLVGEVDFNAYNEKVGATGPWWDQMLSHVFLLLFVFLLVVVLMNMLGALAVDEIKGIRRDSEAAVRKSVVDTLLYYTEFLPEWLRLPCNFDFDLPQGSSKTVAPNDEGHGGQRRSGEVPDEIVDEAKKIIEKSRARQQEQQQRKEEEQQRHRQKNQKLCLQELQQKQELGLLQQELLQQLRLQLQKQHKDLMRRVRPSCKNHRPRNALRKAK